MPQVWVLLSHEESDISISYHHWNLRSVLKPSPTSLKSQDTLNIFRRTRAYPSVLRKVWPVYCSNTITAGTPFSYLLFDFIKEKVFRISLSRIFNLISDFYEFEINHSQIRMLANTVLNSFCESPTPLRRKEKWSDFPRNLFCVSVTDLFIWKNCTNYQIL